MLTGATHFWKKESSEIPQSYQHHPVRISAAPPPPEWHILLHRCKGSTVQPGPGSLSRNNKKQEKKLKETDFTENSFLHVWFPLRKGFLPIVLMVVLVVWGLLKFHCNSPRLIAGSCSEIFSWPTNLCFLMLVSCIFYITCWSRPQHLPFAGGFEVKMDLDTPGVSKFVPAGCRLVMTVKLKAQCKQFLATKVIWVLKVYFHCV